MTAARRLAADVGAREHRNGTSGNRANGSFPPKGPARRRGAREGKGACEGGQRALCGPPDHGRRPIRRGNPMVEINDTSISPIEPIPPPYRQIGNLAVCAWCGERAKSAFAITDPSARAVFNIGNCGRPACVEEAAKVRARVAVHQRIVDLT
jgi:hypothetical protein